MEKIKVTIFNEHIHEQKIPEKMTQYPNGLHGAIAQAFKDDDRFTVRYALMEEPDQGLPNELLDDTDVLIWWGHCAHAKVEDRIADKVQERVLNGMGLIALHASHKSKPMVKLLGTPNNIKWRVADDSERVWVIEPSHPIAKGLPESFLLDREEMYGEPITYARPDHVIFMSWYSGGEIGRSGNIWYRGNGRIFYFQPGHETNKSFQNENVQKIIKNAVRWACPIKKNIELTCPHFKPLEK